MEEILQRRTNQKRMPEIYVSRVGKGLCSHCNASDPDAQSYSAATARSVASSLTHSQLKIQISGKKNNHMGACRDGKNVLFAIQGLLDDQAAFLVNSFVWLFLCVVFWALQFKEVKLGEMASLVSCVASQERTWNLAGIVATSANVGQHSTRQVYSTI
eukprot:6485350-Amphidinium_carterae.1